ncbi:MAG: hypothetical protein QM767_11875 [Anaeromyxobacter sp.]
MTARNGTPTPARPRRLRAAAPAPDARELGPPPHRGPARGAQPRTVRSWSATDEDIAMLEAVARYHGFSRSATLSGLVRREFWRLFPAGTEGIKPARGARVRP